MVSCAHQFCICHFAFGKKTQSRLQFRRNFAFKNYTCIYFPAHAKKSVTYIARLASAVSLKNCFCLPYFHKKDKEMSYGRNRNVSIRSFAGVISFSCGNVWNSRHAYTFLLMLLCQIASSSIFLLQYQRNSFNLLVAISGNSPHTY